jgi:hypothetical protein
LEDQLGLLAMRFRSTRDESARNAVTANYAEVVRKLIDSGKWKEMPAFEDMLPGDRMPEAFYIFWSIPSPVDRTPDEPTKPTIILEGQDDVAILNAVLPRRVVDMCKLRPAHGRSSLIDAARKHISQHHAPVGILFATNTVDKKLSRKMVDEMKEEMASVEGETPFDVFCCIPHIEVIFFEANIDLQRIFPAFKTVLDRRLTKTDPKGQLEALFERGRGPSNLSCFLDHLTRAEEERVCYRAPIPKVIAFVIDNLALTNGG